MARLTANEAILAAVAHRSATLITETFEKFISVQQDLHILRKLLKGMNDFNQLLQPDERSATVVSDLDKIKEAEGLLWTGLETFLSAFEPNDDDLKEVFGEDDDEIHKMRTHIMNGRASFAEARAEALED